MAEKQLNKLLKMKGLSKEIRSAFEYDVDTYEKAIVLKGDTKPHRQLIKEIGGKWNATIGGWIFSKKSISKSDSKSESKSEIEEGKPNFYADMYHPIPPSNQPLPPSPEMKPSRPLPQFIPTSLPVFLAYFVIYEESECPIIIGVFQSKHSAYCAIAKYLCSSNAHPKLYLKLDENKKEKFLRKMETAKGEKTACEILNKYFGESESYGFYEVQPTTYEFPKQK